MKPKVLRASARESSQSKELAQALGLSAAYGELGVLAVVHPQLIGALEPGEHFFNPIDVDHVRSMRAPEEIGIEALLQLFERSTVGMAFHRGSCDGDDAFFDRCEANVLLIDENQTTR